MKQNSFKKNRGNAGLDGVQFQVNLLTVFLLNALRSLNGWRISTENEDAGKFDDIALELSDGSAILLQAKHKNNRKITKDQLLSDNFKNADFSLAKYFLSYQEIKSRFKVKNIIVCTNADIDEGKLKDILKFHDASANNILHCGSERSSYITFNENILFDLMLRSEMYYDKNLKGKGMGKEVISDENLRDFLKKLQFFTSYPSGGNLNKVIDVLLSHLSDLKLWNGISFQEIYGKVEEWFKDGHAEYLTETYANMMCCEIRSEKYLKALKSYSLSFEDTSFYFREEKRVFQVKVRQKYLLDVLKIYCALHERKTLYVDPEDGPEMYRMTVEAFELPSYEYLVLILVNMRNQHLITEIGVKLKHILHTCKYKKVILIGSEALSRKIVHENDILEVDESVTIDSLTKDSMTKLVKKNAITFQGEDTSLEKLLAPSQLEDNIKTINSEILEMILKGEKVKVGARPSNLEEQFTRYYIKRTFERETDDMDETNCEVMSSGSRTESVTEENIFEVTEKVVLISDSAGTGKSTVLAKIAANIKEEQPHLWIIRIALNDYTRIFRDSLKKRKDPITITELLNSNETARLSNQLERIVFSLNEKVVIMLDGLDEISPDYTELVLSMLGQCYRAANFAKIFVTTRPHMNRELEVIFNAKPFELQPFTVQDQTTFLASYWVSQEADEDEKMKCTKYSVTLLHKMSTWINKGNNFTSVPLQLRMIAEIFEENTRWLDSTDWEGCKEFLLGNAKEPKLPDKMNITKLYEMFVEKKLDVFVDKANPSGSVDINRLYWSYFDKYITNHQSLALRLVFDTENICSLFSSYQYDKSVEPEMLKIGIVQKTNEDLGFGHRTFAEYFVAKSVLEISQLRQLTMNKNVSFQKFFIDEMLCYPDFAVIRAFLESAVEDVVHSLPSNIFENYRNSVRRNPKSWKYRSEMIHLLAGEGCLSILRLVLKCVNFGVKKTDKQRRKQYVTEKSTNTLEFLENILERVGIDIVDEFDRTPLRYASKKGHLNVARFLVKQGANVNAVNIAGCTSLHCACQEGYLDIVEFLVQQNADVNIRSKNGFTALYAAVRAGHLIVARFLIEHGANVNVTSNNGFTILHIAATRGYMDIIRVLVQHGADVNVISNNNYTAMYAACKRGYLDVIRFLLDCGATINNNLLHSAVQTGRLDIVTLLVERGADIDYVDSKGLNALHVAAQNGHLDIVRFLVERGLDVNLTNKHSFTALHLAAKKGDLEIVRMLIRAGADIQKRSTDGCTALHFAAQEGHLDTVKFLAGHAASVNVRNNKGLPSLHAAAHKGYSDIVAYLVERGADVNSANNDGLTALHWAAQGGHLDVVRRLVEGGAEVNITNNSGFTALHAAAKGGSLDVVRYLVDQGADVSVGSSKGVTALCIAAQRSLLDIVEFLVSSGADSEAGNCDGFTEGGCLDVANLFGENDSC